MDPPATDQEIDRAWEGRGVPLQLRELWTTSRQIYLIYSEGSDGLHILDPETSRVRTDRLHDENWIEDDSYHADDVLMGDFQGDDRRLVFSPSDGWLIYSAIEDRESWLRLGSTLDRFLIAFRDAGGSDGDWTSAFSGSR